MGGEVVRRLKRFTEALVETEDIGQRFTCRTVKLSLRPRPDNAVAVKSTRRKLSASQAIFAQFLGVSISAVRDWEQGLRPPGGPACRVTDEINRDPKNFRKLLKNLATTVEA